MRRKAGRKRPTNFPTQPKDRQCQMSVCVVQLLHVLFTTPSVRLYLDVLLCSMVYSWISSIPHAHVDNLAHSLVLQRETIRLVQNCPWSTFCQPVGLVFHLLEILCAVRTVFACVVRTWSLLQDVSLACWAVSCCETARALSVQSSRCVTCEFLKQIIGVDTVHASLRDCLCLSFY